MLCDHTQFYWLIWSVHQEPSHKKLASICAVYLEYIVTSNVEQTLSNFNDLFCLLNQEPSYQNVSSIKAYMCSILREHSNL